MTNHKIFLWVFMIFCMSGIAQALISDSIIGHYNHDISTIVGGVLSVSSLPIKDNGTISGALFYPVGKLNGALYFDGSNDQVRIAAMKTSNLSFSVSLWTNSTHTGNYDYIISKKGEAAGDWFIRYQNTNAIRFGIWNGSVTGLVTVTTPLTTYHNGNYYFLAMTYDGTNMTAYVDGAYIGSVQANMEAMSTCNEVMIGDIDADCNGVGTGTFELLGTVDEVSLWNRSLSAAEVSAIYDLENHFSTYPFSPLISINSIINDSNYSASHDLSYINFSYDYAKEGNCSLYVNNVMNATNQTVTNGTALIYPSGPFATGYYNVSIQCTTVYDPGTSSNYSFYADTSFPSCNFPSSILVENNNYTFNVTCTDENFFSLNITCFNNNWSHVISGLNVLEFNLTNNTVFNESDICSYEYCDGHTLWSIDKSWDNVIDKNKVEFLKKSRLMGVLVSSDVESKISVIKKKDRVSFVIDFSKNVSDVVLNMTFPSDSLYYFKDKKYEGWVVDSVNKLWFDLNNNAGIKDFVVKRDSANTFLFYFKLGKDKRVEFDSIGELNCVNGFFNVIIEEDYVFVPGVCPSELSDVMLMLGLLGFGVCLMFLGIAWQARFFGVFGCLLLMVLSWSLAACSLGGGLVFGCFAVVGILWFSLKA